MAVFRSEFPPVLSSVCESFLSSHLDLAFKESVLDKIDLNQFSNDTSEGIRLWSNNNPGLSAEESV
jgi:hypothetical protein